MLDSISGYQAYIEKLIQDFNLPDTPKNLYSPLDYFLELGGKRMRAVLALMGAELFTGDYKVAKHAALAVEFFHNFSLIHDDIMDEAPLRRGNETVHKKWDTNIAILSGDALLIEAYRQLEAYPGNILASLFPLFNRTATEVCEGQQWDMDFESQDNVQIDDYLKMIEYKTAVLLGCSLKMGAIIGNASDKNANELYAFGVNLGIAFQLQDDILDVYADQSKFGKQVGGDIIANKKTYLLLKALEDANEDQIKAFQALFNENDTELKVSGVKALYAELSIKEKATSRMNAFYDIAMENLDNIDLASEKKLPLRKLAEYLLGREH